MLHEIFKGMDNAAEKIDENFQNGSIVESGENENGFWVKWGNGFQLCMRTIPSGQVITTGHANFVVSFPAPFSGRPYVDFSPDDTDNLRSADLMDNVFMGVSQADQGWRLRARNENVTTETPLTLIAIGMAE